MKIARALVIIGFLFLISAVSAGADIIPPQAPLGVFSQDANRVPDMIPAPVRDNAFEFEKFEPNQSAARWLPRDNKWGEEASGNQPAITPVAMPHVFINQDSMSAFGATMTDATYTTMSGNLVASPMSVLATTWHLTEPGVAAGMLGAMGQSNYFLYNRYASQDALLKQFDLNKEWGPQLSSAYFHCMSQEMSEAAGGTSANPQQSWIHAHALCSGDTDVSGGSTGGGGPAGGKNQGIQATGQAWKLSHDPFAETMSGGSGGGDPECQADGENGGAILVSSYLFGKKTSSSGSESCGAEESGSGGNPMDTYRREFKCFVGDACILMKAPDEGASPGSAQQATASIEISKIAPKENLEEIFRKLVTQTYNAILDILLERCKYAPDQFSGSYVPEFAGGGGGGGGKPKSFWESPKIDKKLLVSLSVPGYSVRPITLEGIYQYAIVKEMNAKEPDCDGRFGKSESYNDIVKIASGSEGGGNTEDIRNEARALFILAYRIALGKMLSGYMQAEEVVRRLTAKSFNSIPGSVALELVYDVSGTQNLKMAYDNNLAELRDYIEAVQKVAAVYSGRGGSGLTGIFSSVGKGMNSMANSQAP